MVDLMGKGRHIRTVPVPDWVKVKLDEWSQAAAISEGRLFRCVSRSGSIWGGWDHGKSGLACREALRKASWYPAIGAPRLSPLCRIPDYAACAE